MRRVDSRRSSCRHPLRAALAAPTPKDQLLVPPSNATHLRRRLDGREAWRRIYVDHAGWPPGDPRIDPACAASSSRPTRRCGSGADGMPTDIVIRGVTPSGDAAETFAIADGKAAWTSPVDKGNAGLFGSRILSPAGRTVPEQRAGQIDRLLAAGPAGLTAAAVGPREFDKVTSLRCRRTAGQEERRPHLREGDRRRPRSRYGSRTASSSALLVGPGPASRRLRRQSGQDAGRAGLRRSPRSRQPRRGSSSPPTPSDRCCSVT